MIRLFSKPVVVELDAPRYPTAVEEAAIETLKDHPGFQALIHKLRLQKNYIKACLETERDDRERDRLQEGIRWISYLEREVGRRVHKHDRKRTLAASAEELEEFANVRALIERIEPQSSK